jgi:hypothetical protein
LQAVTGRSLTAIPALEGATLRSDGSPDFPEAFTA